MGACSVSVDGVEVAVAPGSSILQATDAAGVYVPRLCAHPSLVTCGHCGVCAVEVGPGEAVRACETEVAEGMRVITDSDLVRQARAAAMDRLLAIHPHTCLTCDLREGCSRTECSYNIAVGERCCEKFGACEYQKIAAFLGIPEDASKYAPRGLPVADEGLYSRDLNLCIGCLRCEDACRDVAGAAAVGQVTHGDLVLVGPASGKTMKKAGCTFCGACVQLCPTGALMPKKDVKAKRWLEGTRAKLNLAQAPDPPTSLLRLDEGMVAAVPEAEGVYQLYDDAGKVTKIKGVINLAVALREELAASSAVSFAYEEEPLYSARESQLLQQYLAEHGAMPGGDELDDLF
jgi:NADH dehydrogenase/NADH:ubiquinone oxidoreductase subunit G